MRNIFHKYYMRYGFKAPIETRFFYVSSLICFIGLLINTIFSLILHLPTSQIYVNIAGCLFISIVNFKADKAKTKKEKNIAIIIFCLGINCFIFPLLYITSGGIHSAIAMYFIIGIVVTILLLYGKQLLCALIIESIVYTATFAVSYTTEIVSKFMVIENERYPAVAIGCVLTGIAIGIILRIMTKGFEDERTKADDLVEKLEDLTTQDALTGTFNRRFLMSYIDNCIERVKTGELNNFCIIMYDLDHFKHINDTYGHIAGDEVLKSFAKVLRSNMRNADIVARYGGEEFIIVMPTAEELTAFRRAEQIRSKIESIYLHEEVTERITVSGGVSSYNSSFTTAEEMIEKADTNLYIAKDQGRNRIVWKNGATPPVCYSIFC